MQDGHSNLIEQRLNFASVWDTFCGFPVMDLVHFGCLLPNQKICNFGHCGGIQDRLTLHRGLVGGVSTISTDSNCAKFLVGLGPPPKCPKLLSFWFKSKHPQRTHLLETTKDVPNTSKIQVLGSTLQVSPAQQVTLTAYKACKFVLRPRTFSSLSLLSFSTPSPIFAASRWARIFSKTMLSDSLPTGSYRSSRGMIIRGKLTSIQSVRCADPILTAPHTVVK